MKRPGPLRAKSLSIDELHRASGARGTSCGNMIHCNACGVASATSAWTADGQSCPSCGCPINMGIRAWNGDYGNK